MIVLKKIESVSWKYTLYEDKDHNLYGDFCYSPRSTIDLSMIIKLYEEEITKFKLNHHYIAILSDKVRLNYKNYLSRALKRENFVLNKI